jgi:hypothetical protein
MSSRNRPRHVLPHHLTSQINAPGGTGFPLESTPGHVHSPCCSARSKPWVLTSVPSGQRTMRRRTPCPAEGNRQRPLIIKNSIEQHTARVGKGDQRASIDEGGPRRQSNPVWGPPSEMKAVRRPVHHHRAASRPRSIGQFPFMSIPGQHESVRPAGASPGQRIRHGVQSDVLAIRRSQGRCRIGMER